MKKNVIRLFFGFVSLYLLALTAFAAELLIPVGQVVGLELYNDAVIVAAFDDSLPCGRESGLQIGDEICCIDELTIDSAEDVRRALKESDGSVDVTVNRSGREQTIHIEPQITDQGPKLGVYLRQGITGIGTVTWYDPETGSFGTLGHAVNDGKGNLLKMSRGNVYPATVVSVRKGRTGEPGQLKGALNTDVLLGSLKSNRPQGVFGTVPQGWEGEAIPVASCEEIRTGDAVIRSTVSGGAPREYGVEIIKLYPRNRADGRNMLIHVTDPELIAATGGIVQGMGVSYNRDNTGTLRSLQGLGDSPGFSLTKKNLCTRAGTQGRTSFVSSDQAIRMKYIERRFYNLSTLIKQPNIILPHRIRHRAVSVTLFGAFCFDWRKL